MPAGEGTRGAERPGGASLGLLMGCEEAAERREEASAGFGLVIAMPCLAKSSLFWRAASALAAAPVSSIRVERRCFERGGAKGLRLELVVGVARVSDGLASDDDVEIEVEGGCDAEERCATAGGRCDALAMSGIAVINGGGRRYRQAPWRVSGLMGWSVR